MLEGQTYFLKAGKNEAQEGRREQGEDGNKDSNPKLSPKQDESVTVYEGERGSHPSVLWVQEETRDQLRPAKSGQEENLSRKTFFPPQPSWDCKRADKTETGLTLCRVLFLRASWKRRCLLVNERLFHHVYVFFYAHARA